ncbi:hypothetical protein GCK72_022785 [Caenorhabditis remanei]|uniref:F-box associated domain-containing protein n=1 Tax=Caenorhabditis remanei TaxID=31234 RepID=A0A6A5FUU9_CAERE|nr:hypothetical protein GCK72_022785 [Caenorhabditis remanei]KAF1746332.1 hypothetical protein GCK72_022785 [Caenorhabditis remanei]
MFSGTRQQQTEQIYVLLHLIFVEKNPEMVRRMEKWVFKWVWSVAAFCCMKKCECDEVKRAFSLKSIIYQDAHWIEIEDLYKLQNAEVVKIGDNNDFTNCEYNMLIVHWMTHEGDMFKTLEIGRKRTGALHVDWFLKDVVYLEIARGMGGDDGAILLVSWGLIYPRYVRRNRSRARHY